MSDAELDAAPRKYLTLKAFLVLLLLFIAWFLYQLFGPNPKINVSKETTVITEPLGPDGLPDFKAYLLAQDSKEVTPENNAAVLIWQATWPGELEPQDQPLIAEAIGMKEMPTGTDSLAEVDSDSVFENVGAELAKHFSDELGGPKNEFLRSEKWEDWLKYDLTKEAINEASRLPWTSEKMPTLAEWVKTNQKPLDLLVEAAARPKYFSPSPSLLGDKDGSLVEILLPHAFGIRGIVQALLTRAMWHLGAGKTTEAWEDIYACLRLARHINKEKTLVHQLVAIAIDDMAFHATLSLLQHNELSTDKAKNILAELLKLPPVSAVADAVDQGGRLAYIDSFIGFSQGKHGDEDQNDFVDEAEMAMINIALDWNHVLREGNRWHDRLVESMRMPTYDERLKQFAKIDSELNPPTNSFWSTLGFMVNRSQTISDMFISLLLPTIEIAQLSEDRANTHRHLTLLAAALALHRTQHGIHPESLQELVPAILPELPIDLYSEKPFLYQRKEDGGYLLYSVFENQIDDSGTNQSGEIINGEWNAETPEDFDPESSDLVIRVPQPAFKLPELPLEELGP